MRIHAHKHQVASDKRSSTAPQTSNAVAVRLPPTQPSSNGQTKSKHARPASVRPPIAALPPFSPTPYYYSYRSRSRSGHVRRAPCAGAVVCTRSTAQAKQNPRSVRIVRPPAWPLDSSQPVGVPTSSPPRPRTTDHRRPLACSVRVPRPGKSFGSQRHGCGVRRDKTAGGSRQGGDPAPTAVDACTTPTPRYYYWFGWPLAARNKHGRVACGIAVAGRAGGPCAETCLSLGSPALRGPQ